MKKLRDRLEMRAIASYYIKTLFLWELHNNPDKSFWRNKPSVCFKHMLEKFHTAILEKNIPYFWHKDNNLIESLKPTLQKVYADKLKEVLDAINANDVDKVVAAMLSVDEMNKFKESDVYLSHQRVSGVSKQTSVVESSSSSNSNSQDAFRASTDEVDGTGADDKVARLERLVRDLEDRLSVCEEKLMRLEIEKVAALVPRVDVLMAEEPLVVFE